MLKVMSITGSRADYGLMRPIYSLLKSSTDMTLQLIVLGMHNHSAYEKTLEQIYNDGFGEILRIQNENNKQSKNFMLDEMSNWIYHIPRLMERNEPDILLLQGDRGEMLAGAIAAAHKNVPIVHMSGGDVTGSVDNHIRNAVSKFSHFHLATCQSSARNLELMGELPERIKIVGEPSVDAIYSTKLIDISEFKRRCFIPDEKNFALISFHPVTNDLSEGKKGIELILKEVLDSGMNVLVTYPNTDTGSEEIVSTIEKYRNNNLVTILPDMGQTAYFSAMKHAKFLIGNSSSGIIESPYFGLPTINVGSRQELREKSSNVIDVRVDSFEIRQAINKALFNSDFIQQSLTCLRPYGEGDTATKTIEILRNLPPSKILLRKYQQGFITG